MPYSDGDAAFILIVFHTSKISERSEDRGPVDRAFIGGNRVFGFGPPGLARRVVERLACARKRWARTVPFPFWIKEGPAHFAKRSEEEPPV